MIYMFQVISSRISLQVADTVESSVNIFRPDLYFLNLFKEQLAKSGIKFSGEIESEEKTCIFKMALGDQPAL